VVRLREQLAWFGEHAGRLASADADVLEPAARISD